MGNHPASCKDPDNCDRSYVEHLRGFVLGVAAIPTRAVNRTPRSASGYKPPDEPAIRTLERQKRWDADLPAFERLHKAGQTPDRIDGSAAVERSLGG